MRHLIPHYFVSTNPLGWKCSDCGHPFWLPVAEPVTDEIPASITALFNAHKCRVRTPAEQPRSETSSD